jgi:DNA repair protein RecN (Recombination protein N)
MLQELHIENFALIDRLSLIFGAGLNVLTGETGAGKSIIIDALGLVLGERANANDLIRTGADRSVVEAVFDISGEPPAVREKIAELGLETDDEAVLLITRELRRGSGKSQCRINGRLMPVSTLKEVGENLVDVHGQHEHQSLLAADRHVDVLDKWLGKSVLALRGDVAGRVTELNTLRRDLERLRGDARERTRTLDLYRFQQDEIDSASLVAGEEDGLAAERTRIANAEKLATAAAEAHAYLTGEDSGKGALDLVNAALASVEHASGMDETLAPIVEMIQGALSYLEDGAHELRSYQEAIEYDPERLEEIETRLNLIRTLKRKYGDTVEEILTYGAELREKLDRLENSEEREADLTARIEQGEKDLTKVAARLTSARKKGAQDFASKIAAELGDLGMTATKFEVSIEPQTITSKGADHIEFLLSPNPGEPLRPLAKIASGGEMSRIMLAMKSVIVREGGMPTMIFDEIDVGVGGRTGQVLGEKLEALGRESQILCITHLAQIASRAGDHFYIEKNVAEGRTSVTVAPLSSEQRVDEIVRMLGGSRRTEAVVQHAKDMLTAR